MKKRTVIFTLFIVVIFSLLLYIIIIIISCRQGTNSSDMNIIFLHHSTGEYIWDGKPPSLFKKALRKVSPEFSDCYFNKKALLPSLMKEYNKNNDKNYYIEELDFPTSPYGWNNNPFDYYNIWVNNAGEKPFMEEPTLEILTKDYQVIIFKHCFPASNIQADLDLPDINSYTSTLSNYKLQYNALRDKMHEFPDSKFILWTGAVQVRSKISEDEAIRANEFFRWVIDEWDLPGDNIYLWDFYGLQTEGSMYFLDDYANSSTDSHPNKEFASRVAVLLFKRIIDVIENGGTETLQTGEIKK